MVGGDIMILGDDYAYNIAFNNPKSERMMAERKVRKLLKQPSYKIVVQDVTKLDKGVDCDGN